MQAYRSNKCQHFVTDIYEVKCAMDHCVPAKFSHELFLTLLFLSCVQSTYPDELTWVGENKQDISHCQENSLPTVDYQLSQKGIT